MNRFLRATRRWPLVPALLLALGAPCSTLAAKDRETETVSAQLLADIRVLASDEFQGRMPGGDGETKTLRWLGKEWFDAGLVSGTNDPGHAWFAPVTFVAREPAGSTVQFQRAKRSMTLAASEAIALTSGRRSLIEGAPLLFVGRGDRAMPSRAELAGRVAVLLDARRGGPGSDRAGASGQGSERQNALLAAGASAVLTVLDGSRAIDSVAARRKRQGYALASEALGGDLEAFVSAAAMERLLETSPKDTGKLAALEAEADRAEFAPRMLDLTASMEATTRETRILTHNLIGKLPGRHPETGAVLLLAHWDHFGICAQPPAEHLICNGAIDNASGVAALTAIARRLAKMQRQGMPGFDRDVFFLATTGEEQGLLGAEAFAESPPLPLKKIVAAFNLDTVAIAPAGTALGLVGKGMTPLDAGIAQVAKAEKRKLSESTDPNTYVRRQDGWALMRHDVPAVMVTSAYGDVARLERFFDTDYHRPSDILKPQVELGGAAEDVLFHVALVRWFADPRRWPGTR